jgi:hypothetical protein
MPQTFEIGTKVRVVKDRFSGKEGTVNALAKEVRFCIGVSVSGEDVFTIWFEPDALEIIE